MSWDWGRSDSAWRVSPSGIRGTKVKSGHIGRGRTGAHWGSDGAWVKGIRKISEGKVIIKCENRNWQWLMLQNHSGEGQWARAAWMPETVTCFCGGFVCLGNPDRLTRGCK